MAEAQLTPTQQAALLELAHEVPVRSDIVKQQLARAKALRDQHTQVPAYGRWGPAFNGLGNAVRDAVSGYQEAKLQHRQLEEAKRVEELLRRASPFEQRPAPEEAPDVPFTPPISAASEAPSERPIGVTPEWGMDLTQPAPSERPIGVTPEWGMDLTQPSSGSSARAAGRLAGLSPARVEAALGPDFPGSHGVPWSL